MIPANDERENKRKIKRKNGNRLRHAIVLMTQLTAVVLFIALAVYFVTDTGENGLFGFFDNIFNSGGGEDVYFGDVNVNVYAENDSYLFNVDLVMERCIFNYFKLYYDALGTLSESTELGKAKLEQVYTHTSSARLFDTEYNSYFVRTRKNAPNALTYSVCDVAISYVSAGFDGETLAEIELNESFTAAFDGLNGTVSTELGRRHVFVLKKINEAWYIDKHEDKTKQSSFINSVYEGVLEEDGFVRSDITLTYMSKYVKLMYENLSESINFVYEPIEAFSPETEYTFNTEKAVEYALIWTDRYRSIRNLSGFTEYDDNSMNFISQCIFAGGVPMDVQGYEQWKWFGNKLNRDFEHEGYSKSWIDGEAFADYFESNEGFGIKANFISKAEAKSGDIVQTLDKEGKVLYQAIITEIINGEIIVCGNSPDLRNFPLSALGFENARIIRIYGYNT